MTRSSLGGTDYSLQSFDDVIKDLTDDVSYLSWKLDLLEQHHKIASKEDFWKIKVPIDFKIIYSRSLKAFETAKIELEEILNEIQDSVELHHIKLLKNMADVSFRLNRDVRNYWHREYDPSMKEYGNPQFNSVEHIYAIIGDTANSIADNVNCANRLEDFSGKIMKNKEKHNSILFLSASPSDQDILEVGREARIIEEQIQSSKLRESFIFQQKSAVKPETITKALLESKSNIIHFSGHGNTDYISTEDERGNTIEFPIESLELLFKSFSDQIDIVILNSCYSELQAEVISKLNIYVIGMNSSVDDDASIEFSKGFYQALASGKDIEFSFDMGKVLLGTKDSINIPALWFDGQKIK